MAAASGPISCAVVEDGGIGQSVPSVESCCSVFGVLRDYDRNIAPCFVQFLLVKTRRFRACCTFIR